MGKLSPGNTSEILDEASAVIYDCSNRFAKESSLLPFKVTETDLKKQFPSPIT